MLLDDHSGVTYYRYLFRYKSWRVWGYGYIRAYILPSKQSTTVGQVVLIEVDSCRFIALAEGDDSRES